MIWRWNSENFSSGGAVRLRLEPNQVSSIQHARIPLLAGMALVLGAGWAMPMTVDLYRPELLELARPGEVLVERQQRRAQLRAMDAATVERLCGPIPESRWPRHGTVRNVGADSQPAEGLALTLMRAAATTLAYGQPAARRIMLKTLRRFARKNALSRLQQPITTSSYYNLDRTLLPIITSYGMVRDDPMLEPEERARIDEWLDGLIRMRGPDRVVDETRISSNNNHRYLRASVTMAWGAVAGDRDLYREGIRRYHIALEQMRDDGSLPLETARGGLALFYQRHAIASLVTIAEIAAVQGLDLYERTSIEGRSLHDMIAFLARGVKEPEVMERYAAEPQDMRFLVERGHGRHYMAWLDIYEARFPDAQAVSMLRAAMDDAGSTSEPHLDDYSGAMTSCLFGFANSTIN